MIDRVKAFIQQLKAALVTYQTPRSMKPCDLQTRAPHGVKPAMFAGWGAQLIQERPCEL
jgi:hypothetical protein